jgi:D-alanyl-D-alanine carboxypeptidase (penicillin-binding protein 5/6)
LRRIGVLLLCFIAALSWAFANPLNVVQSAAEQTIPAIPTPPLQIANIPVILLVDLYSGQTLFERQADLRFVPASMTKAMTAYVAFERLSHGKLRRDQTFTVRPQTWAEWHGKGTSMNLLSGESVPVDALLHGITTVSANDAAVVLAEGAAGSVEDWADLMNAQGARLGMTNSHFATPNGWPDKGKTYVSARDMVRLGEAIITRHNDLYQRYFGKKQFTWGNVSQQNHDPTIGVIQGADGIKTGHTTEAGFNFLGSAQRAGRRLIMVVGGARSEEERTAASRALLEWGFSAWYSKPLFAQGIRVGAASVQGGELRQVDLLAARPIAAVSPSNNGNLTSLRIIYRGPLEAPLAKGEAVAELEIRVAGLPPSRVLLITARAIGKAGPLDRLRNGLMGLIP